jgi:hypothetical protein
MSLKKTGLNPAVSRGSSCDVLSENCYLGAEKVEGDDMFSADTRACLPKCERTVARPRLLCRSAI